MQRNRVMRATMIAGIVLAEIYMLAIVFAPLRVVHPPLPDFIGPPAAHYENTPVSTKIRQILVLAPFLGVFGMAVGVGVGLIACAFVPAGKNEPPPQA